MWIQLDIEHTKHTTKKTKIKSHKYTSTFNSKFELPNTKHSFHNSTSKDISKLKKVP